MERGAPSAAAGIPSVESRASWPHKISIPLYQRALHLFRQKKFVLVSLRRKANPREPEDILSSSCGEWLVSAIKLPLGPHPLSVCL